MGLDFSIEQQQISTIFKQYRNTINIYTEDKIEDKQFYIRLLKRVLADTSIEINDIYPLGSSNEVINACKNDKDSSFKKIYIVDGDIFLMYQPKTTIKNLLVLDAYCIENLVIDEISVCHSFYNVLGTKSLAEVQSLINFEYMMKNIKNPLIDLFFNYAISNQYRGFFTLHNIDRFLNNKTLSIDIAKIQAEINHIKNELISLGLLTEEQYQAEISYKQSIYPRDINTVLKIVSGKDFLIPYIRRYCCNVLNFNIHLPNESWKFHFANYCDLTRLTELKMAILNA